MVESKIANNILRIWEHELFERPDKAIDKIVVFLSEKHKN
jgi:very-short-patch-repair endonuclease